MLLDANVLVELVEERQRSRQVRMLVRRAASPLVVSDWTVTEAVSAIGKQLRERELTREQAEQALDDIDVWVARMHRVVIDPTDFHAAETMLRRLDLNLRAGDALHKAIAPRLREPLVTIDGKLASAAERLGVVIVRP